MDCIGPGPLGHWRFNIAANLEKMESDTQPELLTLHLASAKAAQRTGLLIELFSFPYFSRRMRMIRT
jgi:hypothetical protein